MEGGLKNILSIMAGLVMLVGTAFGVDAYYSNKFASQRDHNLLAKSFERYVSESRQDKITERLWDMEDRLKETTNKKEKEILEKRIRELKADQEKIQKQLKEEEIKK